MRRIMIAVALLGAWRVYFYIKQQRSTPARCSQALHQAASGINVQPVVLIHREPQWMAFSRQSRNRICRRMSMIWGTEKGLARDQMSREELEKRLVIMQCSLNHDSWKIVQRPRRNDTTQ